MGFWRSQTEFSATKLQSDEPVKQKKNHEVSCGLAETVASNIHFDRNHAVIMHPAYRKSVARFNGLQLQGRWIGFRLSQDYDEKTLDLVYDGKHLQVEERIEVEKVQFSAETLLDEFVAGFFIKPGSIEYETSTSYKARLTWESDGSLTWQNPFGHSEGGRLWKLDRMRSNMNEICWLSEEDGLISVFFWRRVPDVRIPDVPRHENNVLWWHGIAKVCSELLNHQDAYDKEGILKNSHSSAAHDVRGFPQSDRGLPNLLSHNRDWMKVGNDKRTEGKRIKLQDNNKFGCHQE